MSNFLFSSIFSAFHLKKNSSKKLIIFEWKFQQFLQIIEFSVETAKVVLITVAYIGKLLFDFFSDKQVMWFLKNRPGHGRLFIWCPFSNNGSQLGLRKPVLGDYFFKKKKKTPT